MEAPINVEDNKWKLVLYGGAIVTFVVASLISYFMSTMPSDVKNGAILNLILSFGLFFVLFFLIIEVYDIHRKLDRLINPKRAKVRTKTP